MTPDKYKLMLLFKSMIRWLQSTSLATVFKYLSMVTVLPSAVAITGWPFVRASVSSNVTSTGEPLTPTLAGKIASYVTLKRFNSYNNRLFELRIELIEIIS